MSNGDFGGGFTFDPGSFFGGIINTIIDVINAIISALVYVFNLLLALADYLYRAIVAVANVLVNAVKVVARGFAHVISDIIHGRFVHLFQDFIDLKNKLVQWLAPVLRILARLRQLYNQYILKPLLAYINLIQHIRQFLVVFRLLGFKWAKTLDAKLTKIEQQAITNTLVLQSYLNLAISVLDLVVDPSLIFRSNILLASMLSALGAIKRVVFFGFGRSISTDEKKDIDHSNHLLDKGYSLVTGNRSSGYTFDPVVTDTTKQADAIIADYQARGSFA